jgi:hypothetical protein
VPASASGDHSCHAEDGDRCGRRRTRRRGGRCAALCRGPREPHAERDDRHPLLSSQAVTVARRLLNRRPDIRGEARCLSVRLSDESSTSAAAASPCTLPLCGLAALVDWEVALVLRASKLQARQAPAPARVG